MMGLQNLQYESNDFEWKMSLESSAAVEIRAATPLND